MAGVKMLAYGDVLTTPYFGAGGYIKALTYFFYVKCPYVGHY